MVIGLTGHTKSQCLNSTTEFAHLSGFLSVLYTICMNIKWASPIPHKYVGHYCEGERYADLVVTTSSGLPSSCRWRVLYFVNVIKISISFPTVLVISHSVTLLSGYNNCLISSSILISVKLFSSNLKSF